MEEKEFYLYKSDEELYVNKVIYDQKKFMEWINDTSLRLGATTENVIEGGPEYNHAKLNRFRMERIRRPHYFILQRDFLGNYKKDSIPGSFKIYHDPTIIKKLLAVQYRSPIYEVESRDMMGELDIKHYSMYDEFNFYYLYQFLYDFDGLKHPEYLELVKEYLKQFQFIETQETIMLKDYPRNSDYQWFMYKRSVACANQKILSLRDMN